jgi:hypothetical protein
MSESKLKWAQQKLIAHRGNIYGPRRSYENDPNVIDSVLNLRIDCEVDVYAVGDDIWLGHDATTHKTSLDWLTSRSGNLWIHAKNAEAMFVLHRHNEMSSIPLNFFWHETDKVTLTSQGYGWTVLPQFTNPRTVLMCADDSWQTTKPWNFYKICTDYIPL